MPQREFLYVIGEHDERSENGWGCLKIGYAGSPEARCAALQTGNPRRVELITKIPGGRAVEKAFHRKFAEYRIGQSEWFRGEGYERITRLIFAVQARQRQHPDEQPIDSVRAVLGGFSAR